MTYDELRSQLALLICDLEHGILPAHDLAQRACHIVAVDKYRCFHGNGNDPRLDPETRRRIEACTRDLFAANPSACPGERSWLAGELRLAFQRITTPESVR